MWNFVKSLLVTPLENTDAYKNLETMITNIKTVASAAVGILAVAVVGFAIYLAYKFFTAEDEGKRKNAKAQLVYAIIGIVVLLAMLILIPAITEAIKNGLTTNAGSGSGSGSGSDGSGAFRIFFPKF